MGSQHIDLSDYGRPVPNEAILGKIKTRIHLLCRSGGVDDFPGCQPVSFLKKHLDLLKREDFLVCEKSDGVRYLLFAVFSPAVGPQSFLINRKYQVRWIPGLFLRGLEGSFHNETLLDGELLVDAASGRVKFLIFDALLISGENVFSKRLTDRLQQIQHTVINRQRQEDAQPFSVSLKQMGKSYAVQQVLQVTVPQLGHESDGVVFTSVNRPYVSGTCDWMLKWKPARLNSIDFEVKREQFGGRWFYLLFTSSSGRLEFYDYYSVAPESEAVTEHQLDQWLSLGERVIAECVLNPEKETFVNSEPPALPPNTARKGGWAVIRRRTDKEGPNDSRVARSILQSIREAVTEEELFDAVPEIRRSWKEREAK